MRASLLQRTLFSQLFRWKDDQRSFESLTQPLFYLLSLRIIKASRISINFQDVERLGDMDIDLLSGVALARLAKY